VTTAAESAAGLPDQGPPEPEVTSDRPLPRWRALWTIIKVVELRLRFIALMAGTALVFGHWDTLVNWFEKCHATPGCAANPDLGFCRGAGERGGYTRPGR
jgi:hypothetical protein